MTPTLLVAVHAHAGVEETVKRHLPYWTRHGHEVVFFSPKDKPLGVEGVTSINLGNEAHSGPVSIVRFKTIWTELLKWNVDGYAIFEYDSICLSKEIPYSPRQFMGNVVHDGLAGTHGYQFVSPFYYLAPWIMPKPILAQIVESIRTLPNNVEGGFYDRYLGFALARAEIPHAGLGQLGFSLSTIKEPDLPAMNEAIQKGAVLIHGIKTAGVLDCAQRIHAYRGRI